MNSSTPINVADKLHAAFVSRAKDLLSDSLFHAKVELTEEEKFLVCFAAGVPIDAKPGKAPGVIALETRHKCAVVKINGRWEVRILATPEKQ